MAASGIRWGRRGEGGSDPSSPSLSDGTSPPASSPPNREQASGGNVGRPASGPNSGRKSACLTCRDRHVRCDFTVPTCGPCQKTNRNCRRPNSGPAQDHDGLLPCPFGGVCRSMRKEDVGAHEGILHFRCRLCSKVFARSNLQDHQNGQPTHKEWDLLPKKIADAKRFHFAEHQSPFRKQGYFLNTDEAENLALHEANRIWQVRKQVEETVLGVLKGSVEICGVHLRHIYRFEDLIRSIAEALEVDDCKIRLLQVQLPDDFDADVKEGDVVAIWDDATFKGFVSRIEGAWRLKNGDARMLWFFCEVYLRDG